MKLIAHAVRRTSHFLLIALSLLSYSDTSGMDALALAPQTPPYSAPVHPAVTISLLPADEKFPALPSGEFVVAAGRIKGILGEILPELFFEYLVCTDADKNQYRYVAFETYCDMLTSAQGVQTLQTELRNITTESDNGIDALMIPIPKDAEKYVHDMLFSDSEVGLLPIPVLIIESKSAYIDCRLILANNADMVEKKLKTKQKQKQMSPEWIDEHLTILLRRYENAEKDERNEKIRSVYSHLAKFFNRLQKMKASGYVPLIAITCFGKSPKGEGVTDTPEATGPFDFIVCSNKALGKLIGENPKKPYLPHFDRDLYTKGYRTELRKRLEACEKAYSASIASEKKADSEKRQKQKNCVQDYLKALITHLEQFC